MARLKVDGLESRSVAIVAAQAFDVVVAALKRQNTTRIDASVQSPDLSCELRIEPD